MALIIGAPQARLGGLGESIEVTARYLHHLGDSADRSALQLLNDTAPERGSG